MLKEKKFEKKKILGYLDITCTSTCIVARESKIAKKRF